MRKNRIKLRKMKYYGIILSNICGTSLSAGLVIFFSYIGSKLDLPTGLISIMLSISFAAGGILAGYLFGKNKRRLGLLNGMVCGAVMYAETFVVGIFFVGGAPPLRLMRYLFLLCASGALGGVLGVNSKIRRPPP